MSYRREVTALGRGGSDTTAVAMAAALGADYCEICSDVDGVYTADPRVVPGARRIPVLSYEETQDLAEAGAKVLNAQAVEFAKEKGIAIYARAAQSPLPGHDPSEDGTVVRKYPPRMPGTVVGVASERDVLLIEVRPKPDATAEARQQPETAALLELLDSYRVTATQLHHSRGGLTLIVSRENLHEEAKVRAALQATLGDALHVDDRLGAVSVIGSGINASFANARKGSDALAAAGIHPDIVTTSSFRITWLIGRARLDEAVQQLHAAFLT